MGGTNLNIDPPKVPDPLPEPTKPPTLQGGGSSSPVRRVVTEVLSKLNSLVSRQPATPSKHTIKKETEETALHDESAAIYHRITKSQSAASGEFNDNGTMAFHKARKSSSADLAKLVLESEGIQESKQPDSEALQKEAENRFIFSWLTLSSVGSKKDLKNRLEEQQDHFFPELNKSEYKKGAFKEVRNQILTCLEKLQKQLTIGELEKIQETIHLADRGLGEVAKGKISAVNMANNIILKKLSQSSPALLATLQQAYQLSEQWKTLLTTYSAR